MEQRAHLPDGSEFEIDQGGVFEKAEEKRAPGRDRQAADAAFRGMTRGENEPGAQLRDRARHFA